MTAQSSMQRPLPEYFKDFKEAFYNRNFAVLGGYLAQDPLLVNDLGIITVGDSHRAVLHQAAWGGDTEMVSFLLDHKADMYLQALGKGLTYTTPGNVVSLAASSGQVDVVKLLLSRGFEMGHIRTPIDDHPIGQALFCGAHDSTTILLDHLKDATQLFDYMLYPTAIIGGTDEHIEKMDAMLAAAGLIPTIEQLSLCLLVCSDLKNSENMRPRTESLLARGADPNAIITSSLFEPPLQETMRIIDVAIAEGNIRFIRLLLQHGGDPTLPAPDGTVKTLEEKAGNNAELLALLRTADKLRCAFTLGKIQPAIDKIYRGGDNPLPLPKMRR